MIVELNKLKIHKMHSQIYASYYPDDLVQSIQDSGLLEKIVVNNATELVILSGVRRFEALKHLGYAETDVIISNTPSSEESLTLISFNKQRQKTATEMVNEIENLKLIWAVKRGRKPANVVQFGKVNTRAKISQATRICTGNISKLELINKKNPELLAKIDQGDLSINQAHKIIEIQEKRGKVIDLNANLPEVISNDNYKIINKSSDDLSDIPDESVQMIFTSPPYWKLRNYTNNQNELGKENTPEEYINRLVDHLQECYRVLKPKGSFFLNLGDTFVDKCLQSIPHKVQVELVKKGFILRNSIIWKKLNAVGFNTLDNVKPSYEFIYHLVKSKKYDYNEILSPLKGDITPGVGWINRKSSKDLPSDYGRFCFTGLKEGKQLEDFWTPDIVYTAVANQAAVKRHGGTSHLAPFPEEICILPILQTTNPGDTVLDIFSGSGSTGAAALILGRKFIAYDIDPSHNKQQVDRFEDATKMYNQAELKKAA
jgi:site-specific DNA-methyltransferase (adenine-specific)